MILKWLLSKLILKLAPESVATNPVGRHRLGFTLEYWRSRDDCVTWARLLYKTPQFQEWLSVLHHELPLDSTIEAVRAHKRLLRMIELMAESLPTKVPEIETTFGAHKEFPDVNEHEQHDKE